MAKEIKVNDLKAQLNRYIHSENRALPITVVEEMQEKILRRAREIEGVDSDDKLKSTHLTQEQFEKIVEEVFRSFKFAQMDAGTAAGVVSAQSIGEPGTQMSLPGNEKVIIKQKDRVSIVEIGDLIDLIISSYRGDSANRDTEVLDVPELEIQVLGLDNDERVDWHTVSQVSRHPPNGNLLEIETRSGRKITSTFSHSFVLRRDNQIVPVRGSELKLGDRLPLVQNIPTVSPIDELDVSELFSTEEIWYGSEAEKVVVAGENWRSEYGRSYSVPVGKEMLWKKIKSGKINLLVPGYVYPTAASNLSIKIPEQIPLDSEFGYFMGIYLAKGNCTNSTVSISNNTPAVQLQIEKFAQKLGIHCSKRVGRGEYGPSETIHMSSSLLSAIMRKICGTGSSSKFVADWILNTPDSFLLSLLAGYFDGDGSVSVDKGQIRATSKSLELIQGISLILNKFGVYSSRRTDGKYWNLRIPSKHIFFFNDNVPLRAPDKVSRIKKLAEVQKQLSERGVSYDSIDMIPGIGDILLELAQELSIPMRDVNKEVKKQRIGRRHLKRLITLMEEKADSMGLDVADKLGLLKKGAYGEVLWDEIVSLRSIESPTEYVYDFSVPEVENFVTIEGLVTHNTLRTFHFSGVREMNVTLGLPRLIEIIDARRKPSTPTMTIALDEDYIDMKVAEDPTRTREDVANEIAQRIELTTIYSVAKSIDIDQVNLQITIVLDKVLMEDKGISIEDIKKKIEYRRSGLKCLTDKDSDERIHVIYSDEKKSPTLQELQKLKDKLINISIKGLKDVPRVMIKKKTNEDGNPIYEITSEGSRFTELLRIPGVDPKRTYTNHIHEVAETLGIEAARNAIKREAQNVMEKQSLEVDERHMLLVADIMTQSGEIQQIGRHGISGRNASVLARAAFEVTVKHLLDAAAKGERDNLVGIIENVIVGQEISLGTGVVDLTISLDYRKYAQKDLLKKAA